MWAWGLTAWEARTHESLARRLAREVPEVTDQDDGDGIGDSADSAGDPIDDQVGDMRAGRLVAVDIDPAYPGLDYLARDVGIDGAPPRPRRPQCTSSSPKTPATASSSTLDGASAIVAPAPVDPKYRLEHRIEHGSPFPPAA